jgi:hypothetical protein
MSVIRFDSITARRAAFGLAVAGLSATVAPSARATEITFPADGAFARAVMPYTPWLFDLAVQTARSFAEITYDRRGYDPVTNSFFVSGLHVKRDAVDVTVSRLRADLTSVMMEGISADTRGLDLPPPLREGLQKIGREKVEGNVLLGVKMDASHSAYDIAMRYDLPDIGALAMTATIDDFHILVPLSDLEYSDVSQQPVLAGSLVKASVAYKDYGLMPAAIDITAEQSGMTGDQLKAGLLAMPAQFAEQIIGELPGGVSPALKDNIFAWASTVSSFLKDEDAIRITFDPAEPVPLDRLQSGMVDEPLIAALNPAVTRGFAEAVPTPAQPGSLAQASALISGAGVPQDREAGARALLALIASGDLDAVHTLAATFGGTAAPDLDPAELASLYGDLLVARALGDGNVGDATLAALTAKLMPEAVLGAERDAAAFFAAHGGSGKQVSAATIGDFDADGLRAAAYDFYEGRGVPRDFTRALTLALVASAAGDPFAAGLRDDLVAAAERKEIVLDAAGARSEAATLWDAYRTANAGNAHKPQ